MLWLCLTMPVEAVAVVAVLPERLRLVAIIKYKKDICEQEQFLKSSLL